MMVSVNDETVEVTERTTVAALLEGLEVLDPGVVLVHRWRPAEEDEAIEDNAVHMYGAVAVKR